MAACAPQACLIWQIQVAARMICLKIMMTCWDHGSLVPTSVHAVAQFNFFQIWQLGRQSTQHKLRYQKQLKHGKLRPAERLPSQAFQLYKQQSLSRTCWTCRAAKCACRLSLANIVNIGAYILDCPTRSNPHPDQQEANSPDALDS